MANGVELRPNSIRIKFIIDGLAHKPTVVLNGEPLAPTPANIKYAHRLAAEIRERIRYGTFSMGDYFPANATATTGQGTSVGEQLELWLGLQTALESSTLKGYRVGAAFWKKHLGAKHLKALKHSDILAALATEPAWTGKTRNNKVSVLRQALQLALRDGILSASPLAGLEAASHQKKRPDPFSAEEADLIIGDMRKWYHAQVANYFEAKFYTGMRTSESLGLRWESIDFRLNHMVVSEGIVLGEHKLTTKTHVARTVSLNSRALAAIKAQKEHTFLAAKGGWVFLDPKTGERCVDDWTPREMYWRPTLKRLGIRYRSPYETRHTFASVMLMAGMTPGYCARQLGHSVEMFLRSYSKWIDGGQNEVEMARLEAALKAEKSPAGPRVSAEILKTV